jgi:DNA repair exonuclease SbcCD ATPase subunit/DNA repair exonuclease SbcCD nuclease subunit
MVKVAHISDTHIRNLKYHKQYKIAFADMYSQLKKLKPDYIIHCGDIAHSKTDISPELVDMATDFLRSLAEIAPTHIILGNHDGNLRNDARQDAITPIVEAMDNKNLFLYKKSGEFELGHNLTFNVLSVFDKENWITKPTNEDRINIALYHGSVAGCKTETGFLMEHGIDIGVLCDFDYAMLGDIHKTNQKLDHEGRVRYCGSTVQQNHGETNDKGFLLWEIEDKDNFSVSHHINFNPNPFITIDLTPTGRFPKNLEIPAAARVRIRSRRQVPIDVMRKAQSIVQSKFKPESITTQNNVDGITGGISQAIKEAQEEDLRSPKVQEKLIREYLSEFDLDEEMLTKVIGINNQINTMTSAEEASRNLHWKLKTLEWDNLFNYGEGNRVDFEKMSGVIGIFGENYSGKSSTVDSLCYAMFNTTSKNARKNYDLINQNKQKASARAVVEVGGEDYVIERSSEKYVKRLKGEITNEARTDAEFKKVQYDGTEESLNGTTRQETDKNIAKHFGTMEDFLLTSMSSQIDSLTFINEKSQKRKEILAKFLDLLLFDEKFKIAKNNVSELRALVKNLEGKDYDNEIASAAADMVRAENATKQHKKKCDSLKSAISTVEEEISDIDDKVSSIPAEIIDAGKTKNEIKVLKEEVVALGESLESTEKSITKDAETLEKINDFLTDFDIDNFREKKERIQGFEKDISKLISEEKYAKEKVGVAGKKSKLLEEVPCGDKFLHCKLLKDATAAKSKLTGLEETLYKITSRREEQQQSLALLDSNDVQNNIDNYEKLISKKKDKEHNIKEGELLLEKFKLEIMSKERQVFDLMSDLEEYEKNKEAIENLEELLSSKKSKEKEIKNLNSDLDSCEGEIMGLYKNHGSLEQQLARLEEDRESLQEKRNEYAAYDYFLRCMHSHGISSDILKRRLPVINAEIYKVLCNVVDFEVYLEVEDRKLDVFIKHPKFEPRPIELGSGAEKTLSAIAIRLALLNVSTMPRGDVFILDEPGTALDENNMEGFSRIVDLIKTQFNKVVLISHLDSLKDTADMIIDIDKKDGFAHINQ